MKKTFQIIFLYISLGFSLNLNSQVSFLPAVNFPNGPNISIITGDFNTDGKKDIVTVGNSGGIGNIKMFKGDGMGGFTLARSLSSSISIQSVISADFNNDGKPDLATSNYPSNTISVRCGTTSVPGFSFTAAASFTTGGGTMAVISGDFNNDAKPDLVSANENTNNISILIGNGLGSFSASTEFSVGNYPRSLIGADFNGDGKLDLAIGNYVSNNVSVLIGNGAGSFGSATNFSVGSSPESISAADFNGDGKQDLVTANEGSNNVSVLLGDGLGGFGTVSNFSVGGYPKSVISADFNGDGKLDLAVANSNSDNVSVLIGNGMGSFNTAINFPTGKIPYSVTAGDFNLDGKNDLATANGGLDSSSVLLNATFAGIEVLNGNSDLVVSIFPNPSNGVVNIEIYDKEFSNEDVEIKIENVLGQEMKKGKLFSKKQQFNISELSDGIYYVQLVKENQIILTKKIVIQK